MPEMDPKLAALLKANPDRRPDEMSEVLYGKRGDIELPAKKPSLMTLIKDRLRTMTK